jgi:hypothetical protein
MVEHKGTHGGSHIGGVSLSSFLQMLEQERKSCTLLVVSGDQQGSLYLDDGILIDARFGNEVGHDAAYSILLWESPVFSVTPPADRMRRIHLPLAHILLDSAKQKDETGRDADGVGNFEGASGSCMSDGDETGHPDPAIRRFIQSISSIAGIKHYFLLNRQGIMITQSSRQLKIGDFIAYCIVSGIQMKNVLDVKGPSCIQLVLENDETILIMPGAGMIIGLLLDGFVAVNEVSNKIGKILANR